MSLHERLRAVGVSETRVRSLGIEPPANPTASDLAAQAGALLAAEEARRSAREQRLKDRIQYQALRQANPFAAARFAAANPHVHEAFDEPPPSAA